MPRLRPHVFHRARDIDVLLPLLVRATRDIRAAQNELRWLKDFAIAKAEQGQHGIRERLGWRRTLRQLCNQRALGKPLQYLLGTEYFGDLEIKCRTGVLIPRQETAASVTHLVQKLVKPPQELRVLDLCTGTGCIPLLFQHNFRELHGSKTALQLLGVDLSPKAIELAHLNLRHQQSERRIPDSIQFALADVLSDDESTGKARKPSLATMLRNHNRDSKSSPWDILISNPPYISPDAFNHTTSRSVRNYEPRMALVPSKHYQLHGIDPGDVFYPRLLDIAQRLESKIVLFEVADLEQAQRVASMARAQGIWKGIEIWRDDPACMDAVHGDSHALQNGLDIPIIGCGNGRSVFAWRAEANEWL